MDALALVCVLHRTSKAAALLPLVSVHEACSSFQSLLLPTLLSSRIRSCPAVQKHSKNLGSFEEGNTLSCEQLQTYLDGAYGPGVISVRKDLMPRWREGVLDSLLSNRDRLMASWKGRTRSFELFGYDFMVDEDFRSWLIEVVSCRYFAARRPVVSPGSHAAGFMQLVQQSCCK